MINITMGEQVLDSPEIRYQGQLIKVENFVGVPADHANLKAFKASLVDSPGAYVRCVEGYFLGGSEEDQEDLVEDDVLNVGFVANRTEEKGLGTLLTRFALEEGQRRGFNRARLFIHNPKFVSIVERLCREDMVTARYFEDYPNGGILPSINELVATVDEIDAEQARQYLEGFVASNDGFTDYARVDCVLDL